MELTNEQKRQLLLPHDPLNVCTSAIWVGPDQVSFVQEFPVDKDTGRVQGYCDMITLIKPAVKLQFGEHVFDSTQIGFFNPLPYALITRDGGQLTVLGEHKNVGVLRCQTSFLHPDKRKHLLAMPLKSPLARDTQTYLLCRPAGMWLQMECLKADCPVHCETITTTAS